MNRFFLTLFFFAMILPAYSQKPIECDTIIECPGASADKIYKSMKYFVAENFVSAQNVIQLDDKEEHHLLCKGNIRFEVKNLTWRMLDGVINFTLDLQAKDGKYRVVFKNFTHENFDKKFGDSWCMGLVCDDVPNGFKKGKKPYKEMQKRAMPLIIDTMAMMLAKLDASVKEPSKKSDW